MATTRKRNKMRSGPASPSTGLVVFLVFFILLSFGLGGWAFSILKRIDERDKDIKKLTTEAENYKKVKEWYRLQTLWAKSVAGEPLFVGKAGIKEADELTLLMGKYEQNYFQDSDDYKAFQDMVQKDKDTLGGGLDPKTNKPKNWDDTKKVLTTNYQEQWFLAEVARESMAEAHKKISQENVALKNDKEKREEAAKKAWKKIDEDFNAKNGELTTQKDEYKKTMDKVITQLDTTAKSMDANVDKIRKDYDALSDQQKKKLKEKDEEIAALRATASRSQEKAKKTVKVAQADLLARDRPKGKIIRVDYTGQMPYIDLGSADGVKEDLTFSIYGRSASGKVDKEPKGSLEISRVIDAHLSQARIITLRDPGFNPVQENDVIFNPAWDPSRKTHVAIAGIIDFGNGADADTVADQMRALHEFISNLERQNVVVDAYLDLRDLKIKGAGKEPGITLNTDFLIQGAVPGYEGMRILDTKDAKIDFKTKTEEKIKALRAEAVKDGVTIIPLHKFAVLTGYRIPRTVQGNFKEGGMYEDSRPATEQPKPKKAEERLGEKKEEGDGGAKKMDKKEGDS